MNTTEIKAWGLLLGVALSLLVIIALVYNVAIVVITVLWLKGLIEEYLLVKELKTHPRHT